jgi:hypothetical protein
MRWFAPGVQQKKAGNAQFKKKEESVKKKGRAAKNKKTPFRL